MKCAWCGRPDSDGTYCSPKCKADAAARDPEHAAKQHEEWLDSLTDEERAQYAARKLAAEQAVLEQRNVADVGFSVLKWGYVVLAWFTVGFAILCTGAWDGLTGDGGWTVGSTTLIVAVPCLPLAAFFTWWSWKTK